MKSARQLELETKMLEVDKLTHDLSVSIEDNDGARADNFLQKMGERKALLAQKGELQAELLAILEGENARGRRW